ncbi:3-carboxy-cis,cis-muconate cycloisomerase [Hoeflea marina]|nr:3-carboxy-cis,cis-muconate cycloisomerase [Hoeflea marina]
MTQFAGDAGIASAFGDAAMLQRYLRYEIALALALGDAGQADAETVRQVATAMQGFAPDLAAITAGVQADGLPVPDFVRQLKAHVGAPGKGIVHHGATSQDLVDTAAMQALGQVNDLIAGRIAELIAALSALNDRFGQHRLMAITRMQPALAFTAGDRIEAWSRPLAALRERLADLRPRLEVLQFGGPVGNLAEFGAAGPAVAAALSRRIGLPWPGHSWHNQRGPIAEYAGLLSELTGALGKIGQDVALMALRGEDDIRISGGGGSSAMPHKQNPVAAERLVTLARFNATLVSGLHQSLVHEAERSGAAWSLEWLLLPRMCEAAGAGLSTAISLLGAVQHMGTRS